MTEIFYRFKCGACPFTRETKDKTSIPVYCPSCGYPRAIAGHLYRAEPQDGAELDA